MSERWGRDRAAEVHTGHAPDSRAATVAPTGNPDANTPPAGANDTGAASNPPAGPGASSPPGENGTGPATDAPAGPAADVPAGTSTAAVDGRWVRVTIRWVTTVVVVVVAACAARASYDHQRSVVEMAGEHQAAWYLPLSVDGMMLVASLNMLVRRWDGQAAGRLTWCALLLGGAASLAANVAAAEPTLIGRLVAAWPPLCLIVSYELLMQQLPTREGQAQRA